ncbi:MAG TPA: hypothetical protein VEU95_07285 [Micropepsaceae bacterium]|nr:hypothetical protein [Micropepsaceae bacterium]
MRLSFMSLIIGLFITPGATTASFGANNGPHWEAVNAQVPAGKLTHLDVRLIGANGKPVTGKVMVTQTRLDMGPDNMAAMTTMVRPVVSAQAAITSFEAQLSPGRWALNISANVAGMNQPVVGQVVFTAVAGK